MGRLLATINSTKSWAVDMGKPDLLEAATDAYSYWTEVNAVLDGYKADRETHSYAETMGYTRAAEHT
eukprot:7858424-Prorocentrum_lima.AAC.1